MLMYIVLFFLISITSYLLVDLLLSKNINKKKTNFKTNKNEK